ncbi:MAG: sensor histidine kinase, partial [Treponema sp.]|nr:sensor histidine kinase [Treponema sp.]
IALVLIVLAIFMAVTWNVLGKIGKESLGTRRFLELWLSTKADCIALIAAQGSIPTKVVLDELGQCDTLFRAIAEEGMVDAAARLTSGRITELTPLWVTLRDSLRSSSAFQGQRTSDAADKVEALLTLSAKFDALLRARLISIGTMEAGQNRAFITLFISMLAAMLALMVGSSLLAIAATRDRAGKMRLEELMGATFAAQEKERSRFALDLHDSVAQDLAVSLMAARRLPEDGAGSKELATSSLQRAIDSIRRIAWDMRMPELGRFGFRGAALDLVEGFARREGLGITIKANEYDSNGPSPEISAHLYRILQEALANIRKHSHASRLQVMLSEGDGRYRISIEDDGLGFDPQTSNDHDRGPAHLGIAGMKERARLAGGSLEITSTPGQGTRLRVEVPLA